MEYKIRPVASEELGDVYPEYYEQFAMIYNTSLFRFISGSLIRNGLTDLKVWSYFDRTYKEAIEAVNHCMQEGSEQALMAYVDGKIPVAYFRMKNFEHNNVLYCDVAEICLVGKTPPEVQNTAAKELYARVINEIEGFVHATSKDVEAISFETPRANINYIEALDDMGYSYVPQEGRNRFYTELFEKFIRTQKNSR